MIAGLILAGGSGRRLGGIDKPLLTLGGVTLLERIAAAMALPAIAVNANGDPGRYAASGHTVLSDGVFAGEGPLAGVLAGLAWAREIGASAVLTVPGDTPFVPPDLATALSPGPACAASGEHAHHLIALWPVALHDALRDHLSRPGPRHVVRFAARVGMRRVDFPVSGWDPFLNINTPADLALAQSLCLATEIPA